MAWKHKIYGFSSLGVQLPPDTMQEEEMSSLEVDFVIHIIARPKYHHQNQQRYHHKKIKSNMSMQVKGEVVPENRAEIESSIRKSLDTVVASDSVEVSGIIFII